MRKYLIFNLLSYFVFSTNANWLILFFWKIIYYFSEKYVKNINTVCEDNILSF
jgi:hypothetical protein